MEIVHFEGASLKGHSPASQISLWSWILMNSPLTQWLKGSGVSMDLAGG